MFRFRLRRTSGWLVLAGVTAQVGFTQTSAPTSTGQSAPLPTAQAPTSDDQATLTPRERRMLKRIQELEDRLKAVESKLANEPGNAAPTAAHAAAMAGQNAPDPNAEKGEASVRGTTSSSQSPSQPAQSTPAAAKNNNNNNDIQATGSAESTDTTGQAAVLPAAANTPSQTGASSRDDGSIPVGHEDRKEGKKEWGSYTPGLGFKVAETEHGDLNLRLYSYVRFLNQRALDPTYTNFFGTTSLVKQRQDVQVNKAILYFLGWFMSPKLRYLAYVWSTNVSQGLGGQVIVAGNAQYSFNDHFTLGLGINSLPGVRSLELNWPYWLGVDDRTIADEFFRPSYTTGIWAKGKIVKGLNYNVMLGNNLSQLGISAAQLSNSVDTVSAALVWMPTTGEFGPYGEFGDFADHQKVATRIGFHFTRSDETKQSQPNSDSFDNVQIRLSDGSVVFTPNLFGPDITVNEVSYHMIDLDGGIKYRGFSLEAEYYHRWLNNFKGPGTSTLQQINDNGFQIQTSAMLKPKLVQLYAAGSAVFGNFGNPWDARVGINVYPWKSRTVRCNFEFIQLYRSPVGGASLPYPVGGTGPAFNSNFVIAF